MTEDKEKPSLSQVESKWGEHSENHFGYASDEERMAKRGLEDWELVEKIPESQKGVPSWFFAIIAVVLLIGIGLSFPFWGNRPGYHPDWFNWGFVAALFYITAAGTVVYFMVQLYGSSTAGRLDSDKEKKSEDE